MSKTFTATAVLAATLTAYTASTIYSRPNQLLRTPRCPAGTYLECDISGRCACVCDACGISTSPSVR